MHHPHGKHSHGKVSYLESSERRKEFSPAKLLDLIPIKETDNILDFGAGTGYFSIPAAKRTEGNVYALDIDAPMLEIINEKASKEHLENIVSVHGRMEDLLLPDASVDAVIASLVLHEIQPLAPLLAQLRKVLKQDGYLVCLELEPKQHDGKAPRITSEGMEKELKEAGFHVLEKHLPTASLYVLVAQKKNNR
ncbi:class I SAM-dependent methyltransferase [Alkalicoccus daliensis]|uniref:Methyltransferase domain-containing protein n=1 Tax=Alkalicoccus daliensis TaxID=745820 RepID=A0A1H0F5C6_9BACI|nr:class I SAM-dependent methyltransferase [Alkalicoccus daliensis]SDN89796.1 Methyltransferase domain-containing protein [Alkalicoccus daliensis]